jgi:AcrR family transcriptional regulator
VGDLADRRARKKARTRSEILGAAQQLFAERGFDAVTIADVAKAADVAVQTVFNHFATKEELFFAERTPWVDGPADAVRNRPAGVTPIAALRDWTARAIDGFVEDSGTPQRRDFVRLVLASPALRAFELELVHRTEERLTEALTEAWTQETTTAPDVQIAASLTAALWVSAASSLSLALRRVHDADADPACIIGLVETMADRVFGCLQDTLTTALQLPDLPRRDRRAG